MRFLCYFFKKYKRASFLKRALRLSEKERLGLLMFNSDLSVRYAILIEKYDELQEENSRLKEELESYKSVLNKVDSEIVKVLETQEAANIIYSENNK